MTLGFDSPLCGKSFNFKILIKKFELYWPLVRDE